MVVVAGLDRHPKIHRYLSMASVFGLTCFAWIFFRARTYRDAWYVITHMWGRSLKWDAGLSTGLDLSSLGWNPEFWWACILLIIITQWVESNQIGVHWGETISLKPFWQRWGAYYFLGFSIAAAWIFSVPGPKQFLYYQF